MIASVAAVLAIVGALLWVVEFVADPRAAMSAYLVAYVCATTIMLGAALQIMMSHLVGARWFVVLRRIALMIIAPFPVLAILGIPLILGIRWLYPWAHGATSAHRAIWLAPGFFTVRTAIYLILWVWIAERLRRWALYQDHASAAEIVRSTAALRRLSTIGLFVMIISGTFAAFDWTMSLEPTWYSTIYGALLLVGGIVAALAVMILLAFAPASGIGRWRRAITVDQGNALATLLFTFIILWAYFAFSQFLIIWIADIPVEAAWYRTRAGGGWGVLAAATFIGLFAIPFALLLLRWIKRTPRALMALALWIVVVYLAETFWMIRPATSPTLQLRLVDVAAVIAVAGALIAVAAVRARPLATLPAGDPYLDEALRYRRG
jgi:hypothetical protein